MFTWLDPFHRLGQMQFESHCYEAVLPLSNGALLIRWMGVFFALCKSFCLFVLALKECAGKDIPLHKLSALNSQAGAE